MSPDDPHRAATLRVVITDEMGRSLRKPSLARWLRGVAPARARGSVTLALVRDATIRRLNREYARTDRATDVLSFVTEGDAPGSPTDGRSSPSHRSVPHLGDIAIATGVAARQARAAAHSLDTELRILALHGLLHLLGYDHAVDDGTMARLERRLRRYGGLQEGLIDRAGGAGLPRRSSQRKAGPWTRAKAGLPRRSSQRKAARGTRAKAGRRTR